MAKDDAEGSWGSTVWTLALTRRRSGASEKLGTAVFPMTDG
jgi:hypothetical protein